MALHVNQCSHKDHRFAQDKRFCDNFCNLIHQKFLVGNFQTKNAFIETVINTQQTSPIFSGSDVFLSRKLKEQYYHTQVI